MYKQVHSEVSALLSLLTIPIAKTFEPSLPGLRAHRDVADRAAAIPATGGLACYRSVDKGLLPWSRALGIERMRPWPGASAC